LLQAFVADALMARWIPNFCAIKRAANNDSRIECETGVFAQDLVNVDSPLGIHYDFKCVARKRTLLIAVHLARAHFLDRIFGNCLECLCGQNIDALISADREVATGL
jgi:hypothetical protein